MKAYVYVRVTDKSGNITVVNSDGVVVYTDAETIRDTVDFTLLDKADVALDVQLNGNTVAVLYNGTALIDSADYTLSGDGTITLKNRYLSTLAAGERRLAALALQCAGGTWSDTLTESRENNNGKLTFYVKNAKTGVISEVIEADYKID